VTQAGSENDDLVSNVDFAETFLEIAGVNVPSDMHGRSLVPILKGRTPPDWRKSFYYHYYEGGGHGVPRHYGVRTKRYTMVHFYETAEWELFDLEKDPMEMRSVYSDAGYTQVRADLLEELKRLRAELKVPEKDPDL
jgi:arylsulfatase A-like enzyme